MANKVVIETELNTKPLKKGIEDVKDGIDGIDDAAQKSNSELDDLSARLKLLEDKKNKLLNNGQGEGFVNYDAINAEIEAIKANMELISEIESIKSNIANTEKIKSSTKDIENQGDAAEKTSEKINQLKEACNRTSQSIKKMGNSAKKSKSNFAVGLKTILKYAFGIRSLIALFNKMRSAMVEGFRNLAQFNNGVNPTNTALSNLKSALTQLKNSFAVAFAPILTVVEPILTRLISLLSTAMNYVGQFLAALTGASTFTKAIKVQENYAKSLNGTAAAAKKAKGSLASIDELNNQSKQENSGAGGTVSPNDMFEVAPIESKISGIAEKIKSLFKPIIDSIKNWFKNLDFQPLLDSLEKLKIAAEPLIENIGKGLLWLLENVLEPLGSFVIEDALPAFFNLLASAVEACNKAFEVISPYLSEIWNEVFAPFAAFLGETFVGILIDVSQFFSEMGDMFVEKSEEIGTIFEFLKTVLNLVSIKWKVCIQLMSGQLQPFLTMVKNIISHVIDILSGLIKFITGVFTGNWKQAWEGVKDVLKGILNVIIDIVEGSINRIIGALNAISFDIPDIVHGIGGKHVGFNITPVSLPRLATGTVVPRQSREFAAILGDNNRETEVVSPLSTIKQALTEALQERGVFQQSDSGDIVIMIDGYEVFRAVKNQNDSYINRTGKSAFQY